MLKSFIDTKLKQTMKDIIEPYDSNNYKCFMDLAHSLKGTSGYCAAGRIHYVCYYIQYCYQQE